MMRGGGIMRARLEETSRWGSSFSDNLHVLVGHKYDRRFGWGRRMPRRRKR